MTPLKSLFNKKMNRTNYFLLTLLTIFLLTSIFRVIEGLFKYQVGQDFTQFSLRIYSVYPAYAYFCIALSSILLALISIPRLNDCKANRWFALLILIPQFNYIVMLVLMILPGKVKNDDDKINEVEHRSLWSHLSRILATLIVVIVVGFTVTVVGTILLYALQMEYKQNHKEAVH